MTDTSLTLHARGPAEVETTHEREGMTVTGTQAIDFEATIELEEISAYGQVFRQGFIIQSSDIAHHVTDTIEGDGDRTIRPLDASEWELTTTGRIRDYLDVALRAAQETHSSDRKVTTLAAHICANFAEEFATDDRPRLALLDLIEQLDVEEFDRADVLRDLDAGATIEDEPDAEATAAVQEVEADD